MRTPEEIQGSFNLWQAYYEQEKRAAMTCNDVEVVGQHLRKMYDYRIRMEMLEWVLQESEPKGGHGAETVAYHAP